MARHAYMKKVFIRQTEHPDNPMKWGARCTLCPLNGSKPVWGDGPSDAELAVVGEAPGREDIGVGLPFIGKAGELLEAYLDKVDMPRPQVWVDQALMCMPPGGDLKAARQKWKAEAKEAQLDYHDPVDCCRPRLLRALRIPRCKKCGDFTQGPTGLKEEQLVCRCAKPQPLKLSGLGGGVPPISIAALGNTAMMAVLGHDGITKKHGYVFNLEQQRQAAFGLEAGQVKKYAAKKGRPTP